uniref:Uncharacterized protein n=1 Tax=Panagrolaimus superbus TaxID=310955 RepID=A0A914YD30_9BILA
MSFCEPNDNEEDLSLIFSDLGISYTELNIKNIQEFITLKCCRKRYITILTSDNQIAFINSEMLENASIFIKSFIESKEPLKINFSSKIVNIAINLWYGKECQEFEGNEIEVFEFAKEFNIKSVKDKCIKY